nr:dnaJ homolog subfamily C member 28-like [Lytechinus pictus]
MMAGLLLHCHRRRLLNQMWSGISSFHTSSPYLGYKISKNVKDCYQLLNVSEKSSMVEIKEAYFKLAKVYHPDSKSRQADGNKFTQIQQAYNTICLHVEKMEKQGRREGLEDELSQDDDDDDECEFDIKHTVPQHRQYLEYEGIGFGTPSQRQKQYQKYRAMKASDAVSTHRIYKIAVTDEKGLVLKDKKAARKIRTTNVIERLVEDLIQDSMAKGEFDDLPGMGKPLPPKTAYCPYVDAATHNLNEVLVNNGYAPEWIQLEKDIRNMLTEAKNALLHERLKLGAEPLNDYNVSKWADLQFEFSEKVKQINRRVNDFNLIVPIIKLQKVHIQPEKEIAKVLDEYSKIDQRESIIRSNSNESWEAVVEDEVALMASRLFQSMSAFMTRLSNAFFAREDGRARERLR